MPKGHSHFLELALAKTPELKVSTDAMMQCGIQPELAAHLMLQGQAMKTIIILRAGSPPVYNQRRGSKTGFNLSKTSTQGLFKGSLAEDIRFTRLQDRKGIGHDVTDHQHLTLSPKDPNYQHTVALPITMQDILREVCPQGDLTVLGCNNEQLRLAYKEEKGDEVFHGQFIIDLNDGESTPVFYSRPWDKPDHDQNWNPVKKVINKPVELAKIPDEIYEKVFCQIFRLGYTENQDEEIIPDAIKEAKVFANTPRESSELLTAIKESNVLRSNTHENNVARAAIEQMNARTPIKDILAILSNQQIKAVYDTCGLVTTGDWDGLALGHPPPDALGDYPAEKMRVYNTFTPGEDGLLEIALLLEASCLYFEHLKHDPSIAKTQLGQFLQTIKDPTDLFSELALQRAGCITPHEFIYQQLINYSHRDETNLAYGEKINQTSLQAGLDAGLVAFSSVINSTNIYPEEQFDTCLHIALKTYNELAKNQKNSNLTLNKLMEEHLTNHLKIALGKDGGAYTIPHPHYDHNVHDLFQHGFDMRNPYGSNLEGAWFMITDEGALLYGDTQEQLAETLLIGDFLQKNIIDVSDSVDMDAGWGKVIAKQIAFGQTIPRETLDKYQLWQKKQQTHLAKIYTFFKGKIQKFIPKTTSTTEYSPEKKYTADTDEENPSEKENNDASNNKLPK